MLASILNISVRGEENKWSVDFDPTRGYAQLKFARTIDRDLDVWRLASRRGIVASDGQQACPSIYSGDTDWSFFY